MVGLLFFLPTDHDVLPFASRGRFLHVVTPVCLGRPPVLPLFAPSLMCLRGDQPPSSGIQRTSVNIMITEAFQALPLFV